jgi:tetratricopeptide (TPR) repeat protein
MPAHEADVLSKYLKTILNGGVPEEERDPLKEGLALFEAGDYDPAMPLLEEVLEADNGNVASLVAIGRIHTARGHFRKASKVLESALDLEPKNPQINYYMAELSYELQDYLSAEEYFTKATQCDPDYTDAYIRLGMLLSELSRYHDAIKALERAIFLDRAAVVARYQLAQVCVELEDFRRALAQIHLVRELHPDFAPVHMLQGDIFDRLGDYRQAIVELNKVVELGGADANVYWQLGTAHLALKQREKALRAFLHVIEHDPELWPAYYEAAQLQEGMKRFQQARQTYKALLHAEEYAEVANEAIERIDGVLAEIAATMAGDEAES